MISLVKLKEGKFFFFHIYLDMYTSLLFHGYMYAVLTALAKRRSEMRPFQLKQSLPLYFWRAAKVRLIFYYSTIKTDR